MEAADAEADLAVDFEAAGGCQEAEGWGAERVGRWEHDAAVVEAAGEGRGGRGAPQCKVPFEEV